MVKLLEAFVMGKKVIATYSPWNDITKPVTFTEQAYNDLRARVLLTILDTLPKQADNKAKMALAQELTQEIMTVIGKELS